MKIIAYVYSKEYLNKNSELANELSYKMETDDTLVVTTSIVNIELNSKEDKEILKSEIRKSIIKDFSEASKLYNSMLNKFKFNINEAEEINNKIIDQINAMELEIVDHTKVILYNK